MTTGPSPNSEMQATAAQIASSLSQAIMAASVTVLAILAAFYSAVLPQLLGAGFPLLTVTLLIAAMGAFVLSILSGGRGISAVISALIEGQSLQNVKNSNFFNQTISAYAGLVLALVFFLFCSWQLTETRSSSSTGNRPHVTDARKIDELLIQIECEINAIRSSSR